MSKKNYSPNSGKDLNGITHVKVSDFKQKHAAVSHPGEGGHVNERQKGVEIAHPEGGIVNEHREKNAPSGIPANVDAAIGLPIGELHPSHSRVVLPRKEE
jgi:hypothetical protein